jgi:hypothetical protein
MSSECSLDELLNFLALAGERGLMPIATVQALAVATRKVFAVLDDTERARLPLHDLEPIIRRFQKARAEDLNPSSLTEYERRVRRAAELYLQWTHDPARFNVPTRATSRSTRRRSHGERAGATRQDTAVPTTERSLPMHRLTPPVTPASADVFETTLPVRLGHVVQLSNLPVDLTAAEAERLAQFVRLLGAE